MGRGVGRERRRGERSERGGWHGAGKAFRMSLEGRRAARLCSFFCPRSEPARFSFARRRRLALKARAYFSEKGKSITKRVMRPGIVA